MSTERSRANQCAIYTRKSSEEGLEQSFNSLHAQREACQAYILSQRQEGWRALDTHYDDGGYSGGSMERPALKQLLADIDAKRIDTVIVYKVDRLTRSLADFAKIIEAFDARGVSFVSVTQQFNTTSSMGRLTLNVLLSFAQFEREVTGERIRDKIAASKRKGMWMGGSLPTGYQVKDRHLIVHPEEAERVREIFRLYLQLGCVKRLKQHLDRQGVKSQLRISRLGHSSGGAQYSRGALYKMLQNKIYRGLIPHKDQCYPGIHEPIVDLKLWEEVQVKLKENACARRHGKNASEPSLLRGLLYDSEGHRFTPSHAVKNGKRYRYYITHALTTDTAANATRLPARDVEQLVLTALGGMFASSEQMHSLLASCEDDLATLRSLVEAGRRFAYDLANASSALLNENLSASGCRVIVHPDSIEVRLLKDAVRAQLLGLALPVVDREHTEELILRVPAALRRYGGENRMILANTSGLPSSEKHVPSLVKAVSRAYDWMRRIEAGEFKDQRAIAAATGLDERYISRLLPLAFLAPEGVEEILEGAQPPGLSLDKLLKNLSLSWTEQRQAYLASLRPDWI